MSSPRPWEAQHRPNAETVAQVVRAQVPALAGLPVRYFDEGWDFTVFAVGDAWLLRFPKREGVRPWLARERSVLDAIDETCDAPIPRDRFYGEASAAFPLPFVGYRRLPGVPLDALALDAVGAGAAARLGRRVGRALRVVHAVPLDVLPPAPSPRDERDVVVAEAQGVLATLADRLGPKAARSARKALAEPPPPGTHRVVLHRDLGPEHVLVHATTHELTGLIDWADTGPGDPAADFVGLWVELGDACLDAALEAYGGPGDPELYRRVRFDGLCCTLRQVEACEEGWRPEQRDRWIARFVERFA